MTPDNSLVRLTETFRAYPPGEGSFHEQPEATTFQALSRIPYLLREQAQESKPLALSGLWQSLQQLRRRFDSIFAQDIPIQHDTLWTRAIDAKMRRIDVWEAASQEQYVVASPASERNYGAYVLEFGPEQIILQHLTSGTEVAGQVTIAFLNTNQSTIRIRVDDYTREQKDEASRPLLTDFRIDEAGRVLPADGSVLWSQEQRRFVHYGTTGRFRLRRA